MTNNNKDQAKLPRDTICKSHSARTERDLSRICPSKLSRRELEDLYFVVLENNIELKKTINGQQEKIKLLSTKILRLTASQKNGMLKEQNECCYNAKLILDEKNNSIADLKQANERMAERIRILNVRLCSAKQFLKRPTNQATPRCPRCNICVRNNSSSALCSKNTEVETIKQSVSSQCLTTENMVSKTTETEKVTTENGICNENKCRTQIEGLEQKVVELQEELTVVQKEYVSRIGRLEETVSRLQAENAVARAERLAGEHAHERAAQRHQDAMRQLRDLEVHSSEIEARLSVEKKKVAELEARLKSAELSKEVAKTIEKHLSNDALQANQIVNQDEPKKTDRTTPSRNFKNFDSNIPNQINSNLEAGQEEQVSKKNEPAVSTRTGTGEFVPSEDADYELKRTDSHSYLRYTVDPIKRESSCPTEKSYNKLYHSSDRLNAPSSRFDMDSSIRNKDDSGYVDHSKSSEMDADKDTSSKEYMLKRISYLQAQLDTLKISAVNDGKNASKSSDFESYDVEVDAANIPIIKNVNDYNCVIIDPTKKVIVEIGHVNPEEGDNKTEAPVAPTADVENGILKPYVLPATSKATVESQDVLKEKSESGETEKEEKIPLKGRKQSGNLRSRSEHVSQVIPGPIPTERAERRLSGCSRNDKKKSSAQNKKKISISQERPIEYLKEKSLSDDREIVISRPRSPSISVKNIEKPADINIAEDSKNTLEDTDEKVISKQDLRGDTTPKPPVQYDMCEARARVCACPRLVPRDVSVFRSCSGTLRFRSTSPVPTGFRRCRCEEKVERRTGKEGLEGGATKPDKTDRACSPDPQTYTIQGSAQLQRCDRSTSPDNTDNDVSSISETPKDKQTDAQCTKYSESTGEDKQTSTMSSCRTSCAEAYLSEGELPNTAITGRWSIGENPVPQPKRRVTDSKELDVQEVMSEKMEAALHAITEELARCRMLLQKKPSEVLKTTQITKSCLL